MLYKTRGDKENRKSTTSVRALPAIIAGHAAAGPDGARYLLAVCRP